MAFQNTEGNLCNLKVPFKNKEIIKSMKNNFLKLESQNLSESMKHSQGRFREFDVNVATINANINQSKSVSAAGKLS